MFMSLTLLTLLQKLFFAVKTVAPPYTSVILKAETNVPNDLFLNIATNVYTSKP